MTPNEIRALLRAERLRAGLSLQALADKHGVKQPTLRSHEVGDRSMHLEQLVEHAYWLGLEVVLRPAGSQDADAYQRGYDRAVADACGAWGVRTDDDGAERAPVDWDAALAEAHDEIERETLTTGGGIVTPEQRENTARRVRFGPDA